MSSVYQLWWSVTQLGNRHCVCRFSTLVRLMVRDPSVADNRPEQVASPDCATLYVT